uniref:Putative serine protease inhibitor n=1 Tax=Ixodes scapularis TaxID=6945 RepID=A0A4D5RYQ0_IXOSC
MWFPALLALASSCCVVAEPNELEDPSYGGVVRASNDFGLTLYTTLANGSDGNLFFSPWSLSRVLTMVLLGARNETASELSRALSLDSIGDADVALAAQRRQAQQLGKSDELATTSMALTRVGDPVSAEYLASLDRYLDDGGVMQVDFSRADELLNRVNGEVSRLTGGRIRDALRRSPDPLSKLLLLNAVHFKGVWAKAFSPNDTFDGVFRGATKNTPVRMMAAKGKFRLSYDGAAYVLELPYTGDSSLVIVLPRNRLQRDLQDLEHRLQELLMAPPAELRSLELELPQLSLHSSLDLKDALQQMGVRALFAEHEANLSGMQPDGGLFVEDVHHEAALDVDEKGTQASASTVAVIVSRIGTPRFSVDRPFVFALRHGPSGLLLFVGRVLDL